MIESAAVKILLVEDNPGDARLARELLSEAEAFRFELRHVELLADAMKAMREAAFDIVLLDLSLPDSHGVG